MATKTHKSTARNARQSPKPSNLPVNPRRAKAVKGGRLAASIEKKQADTQNAVISKIG
jgi:hypothetical protein